MRHFSIRETTVYELIQYETSDDLSQTSSIGPVGQFQSMESAREVKRLMERAAAYPPDEDRSGVPEGSE